MPRVPPHVPSSGTRPQPSTSARHPPTLHCPCALFASSGPVSGCLKVSPRVGRVTGPRRPHRAPLRARCGQAVSSLCLD